MPVPLCYPAAFPAAYVFPDDRLIQRAAQQGMCLFNHRAGNADICFLVAFQHNGRLVLKRVVEQVQIMRGQVFHRHVAQVRLMDFSYSI